MRRYGEEGKYVFFSKVFRHLSPVDRAIDKFKVNVYFQAPNMQKHIYEIGYFTKNQLEYLCFFGHFEHFSVTWSGKKRQQSNDYSCLRQHRMDQLGKFTCGEVAQRLAYFGPECERGTTHVSETSLEVGDMTRLFLSETSQTRPHSDYLAGDYEVFQINKSRLGKRIFSSFVVMPLMFKITGKPFSLSLGWAECRIQLTAHVQP